MRRLVYYVATTLDGFIAGPDGGDPSGADFFPDEMERRVFYKPKGEGHEEKVKARLERWAEMRARMQDAPEGEA